MYRYSQRLLWPLPSNRFSDLIAARRSSGATLLDLTVSNPTDTDLPYPHLEIAQSLGDITDITYRPDPLGGRSARTAIAAYYGRRGIHLRPERIALTASTSEAYALLFKLFCDPQDEVLVPAPSYPLFEYLAALEAVRVVPYRLFYDGTWFIDMDDLRGRISPRTRALVVVNPNNPTGSYLKPSEQVLVEALALEYRLPILSDEVFMDYALTSSSDRVTTFAASHSVLSFSLNGLSKTAGMPQLKLGWIVINGPDKECGKAGQRLELLLDTYLSVGTPVQRALPKLLLIGEQLQKLLRDRASVNLASAQGLLQGTAAHCLHTEGGWSVIIQLPRIVSEDVWVTRLLLEHSTIVHPGYFFDMPSEAYIVVSLITLPNQFNEGLKRLVHLMQSITPD